MTPGPFAILGFAALSSGLLGSAGLAASVEPAQEDVSPGVLGFLVTLAVVLACIPLFRSMTGKIRGVEFRDAQKRADGADGTDGMDTDAPDAVTSPGVTSPGVTSPKAPTQGPPDESPQVPPPARP